MKAKDKNGNFKIPEDALEKIKSQSELDDFFSDLYKQAVEGMLKAELDDHLGSEKHQTRNGPCRSVPGESLLISLLLNLKIDAKTDALDHL